MEGVEEYLEALTIGISVAIFLLNTHRYDKAIGLFKECLVLLNSDGMKTMQALLDVRKQLTLIVYSRLGTAYYFINDFTNAIDYYNKVLTLAKEMKNKKGECTSYGNLGSTYLKAGEYEKAIKCSAKALEISQAIGHKREESINNGNLGSVYQCLGDYPRSLEYHKRSLEINKELRDFGGEAQDYNNIGDVHKSLGESEKAIEFYEKAILLRGRIGDRRGECHSADRLAGFCSSIGKFKKAEPYQLRALEISRESGDRTEQRRHESNLGVLYDSLGEYTKAKECHENALQMSREFGDVKQEAVSLGNLGSAYARLGDFLKALECLTKALETRTRIGDKQGEATHLGNLGTAYHAIGQYAKAAEHQEKALQIHRDLKDKKGEGVNYGNLGVIFHSQGEYLKAIEYHNMALQIRKELGDKQNECGDYTNIGAAYQSLSDYSKALEYHEKALQIRREIGDQPGLANSYGNLGNVYHCLGEHKEAFKRYEEALEISVRIEDRSSETILYGNIGAEYKVLGDYDKALMYIETALESAVELNMRKEEGTQYRSLADLFRLQGEYTKSIEHSKKALEIHLEIGDKYGESDCYENLGSVYESVGDYTLAIENHEKALHITKETEDKNGQGMACAKLGLCLAWNGDISKALHYLSESIDLYESVRRPLGDSDHFKVSFSDRNAFPYKLLVCLLCQSKGDLNKALYTAELGRARGLADLMSKQYLIQEGGQGQELKISDIETLPLKNDCSVIFLSYHVHELFLWVVKPDGYITFRKVPRDTLEAVAQRIKGVNVEALFESMVDVTYALYKFGRGIDCEDRSLLMFQAGQTDERKDNPQTRLLEEDDHDDGDAEVLLDSASETTMRMWYKMIVAPVEDILDGSELIIVPEGLLYRVPLAALEDSSGKHLSETYKVRVIPSLTTLKLIQASPTNYHSETGALIVGDPDVGIVRLRGREEYVSRLSSAKEEAEMIGRLLQIESSRVLTGRQATKQAVLQEINSVSVIHIAAHGDAERGEICLSPICYGNKVPEKEDFMLTMSDVSNVQLRAKLVVLSCCHSGSGQIKAEGVVGIARAFLGSGARSVLVTLWAVEDRATLQFMKQFYERLVLGESASESLQNTMKWMRESKWYSKVSQWAPFVLVGDDVTLNFKK
ncbi:tetratricopeptide repeat protein 28-like [Orbicella faveolata]|uniref:tetratricopeptide repeat protein 28-like n=1 Tax=Orbicella faveolata TaxID=48498 RepID=UPI0009E4D627|nr:tetratricopeptide repeat protein 28-like [Orbicella faveolata]